MKGTTGKPVIAVLMDHATEGSFSSRPHYALRTGYFEAIEAAGGTPVALPYLEDSIEAFLDIADGVLLPGGFYPFPASYYGEQTDTAEVVHPRAAFEAVLIRRILARNTPVLGICAGMQALAAAVGARLHRNVTSAYETDIDHLNGKPAEQYAHAVSVTPGTLLHRITGQTEMTVNTAHSESVAEAPDTPVMIINARAPDGVVEGLELPGQRFALGVQWHPEFFRMLGGPHLALFQALVTAAGGKAMSSGLPGRVA